MKLVIIACLLLLASCRGFDTSLMLQFGDNEQHTVGIGLKFKSVKNPLPKVSK